MRTFLLLVLLAPGLLLAQSDFRLSTAAMPNLEDALIPLPAPLADLVVREELDAIKAPTPKPDELLKQVVNELKTRQFAQALPKLEYLQSIRPSEPDVLILRGCIYAESGHPEKAEAIFRKAILIAPSHPWARLNLAESQFTQKKFADAEATLTILASTRPESEVVRFKLILAEILQKKFEPAEQELHYLEDHVATPAYYYAQAALAFAKGDPKTAQNQMELGRKNYGDAQSGYFYNALAAQGWVPPAP